LNLAIDSDFATEGGEVATLNLIIIDNDSAAK